MPKIKHDWIKIDTLTKEDILVNEGDVVEFGYLKACEKRKFIEKCIELGFLCKYKRFFYKVIHPFSVICVDIHHIYDVGSYTNKRLLKYDDHTLNEVLVNMGYYYLRAEKKDD